MRVVSIIAVSLLLGLNAQKSIPHDSTHFGKGFSDPFGVPQNTGAQDQSSDIGQGRSVSSGSPDAASQDYQLIGQESSSDHSVSLATPLSKHAPDRRSSFLKRSASGHESPFSHPNADVSPSSPQQLHLAFANATTSTNVTNAKSIASKTPGTTNFDGYLKHISVIAHVANGITLQAGLMNEKIPIDAVVGELFGLRSIELSDIFYKLDKIAAWTRKLKDIPNDLKASTELDELESKILELDQIRMESDGVQNVLESSKLTDYFATVKNVKNNLEKYNFKLFSDANREISTVLITLEKILSSATAKELWNKYRSLPSQCKKMMAAIEAVKKIDKKSIEKEYGEMAVGATTFKPLEQVIDLMVRRERYSNKGANNTRNMVEANLEKVNEINANDASGDFKQILELVNRAEQDHSKMHTIGFSRGILDLKHVAGDARDQWLSNVLNISDEHFARITSGLQPLLKASDNLETLNDKLMTVRSVALSQSLVALESLVTTITSYSSLSKGFKILLNDYDECERIQSVTTDYIRSPGITLIRFVKDVQKPINEMLEIAMKLDVEGLNAEYAKFNELNKYGDGGPHSDQQLETIHENLKQQGSLTNLQNRVAGIQTLISGFDVNNFNSTVLSKADSVQAGMDDTRGIMKAVADEMNFLQCLQKSSSDSVMLSKGVRAIQRLRNVTADEIEPLETSTFYFSELFKELAAIKSIPEKMKNGASKETLELNRMAQSLSAIEYSASALKSAYGLLELESSIGQLKNVDAAVSGEIRKIKNPADIKKLQNQWGDHKKDMGSLENAVAKAKYFVAMINVSKLKTLDDYSAPLKELGAIPDVIMNVLGKVAVLKTLIRSIPRTERRKRSGENSEFKLIAAKAVLDKIAKLDLRFASLNSQFKAAPLAFQSFHTSLVKLFSTQQKIRASQKIGGGGGNAGSSSKECKFPFIHVIVSMVITLILAALVFLAYLCYRKKKQDDKTKEKTRYEDLLALKVYDEARQKLEEKEKLERLKSKSKVNEDGKAKLVDKNRMTPIATPMKDSNTLPGTPNNLGITPKQGSLMRTGMTPAATSLKVIGNKNALDGQEQEIHSQCAYGTNGF